MTAPNPVRVDQLLTLALQQPSQQREEFVRRVAAHDAPLRDAALAQLALITAADDGSSKSGFFGGGESTTADTAMPVSHGLAVGQRIGDFTLVRFLGKGGMGQVWEARQESLRRSVALKLLLPGSVDPSSLEKFVREARAGGKASHKNLVATFGYGDSDGLAWIAQELVHGSATLADAVDRFRERDRLPDDYYTQVARLMEKVARGMQAAHAAGVIHRDLKPANILVGADDEPRVADFGLAKVTDESLILSKTGDGAGTWFYMSPEQVSGKRTGLDARTDIFSLGVVLYEMLTLQRPFVGDSSQQIAEQIDRWDPPVADKVRSHCPRDLAVIAEKAMQKAKAHRYPTMAAMAEDLRRFLADEPILAKPTSAWHRARKWMRRNPTIAATVALVTIGGAVSGWQALRNASLLRDFDSLATVVQLEEAKTMEHGLYPAWPEMLEAMERWRDQVAMPLLDKQPVIHKLSSQLSEHATAETTDGKASAAAFLGRTMAKLATELDEFAGLQAKQIAPRIQWARWLRDARLTAAHPNARVTWPEARTRIRDNPRYAGLNLVLADADMHDLVPIGENPKTGLFEFYHLRSAWDGTSDPRTLEIPQHRADGSIDVQVGSGIVFVLVPGGETTIGSQASDPDGPRHDPEAQMDEAPCKVRLAPYLIARHEITRAQWERLGGKRCFLAEDGDVYENRDMPIDGRFPAESMRWLEAKELLAQHGLTLPSEAQWEHACRGGTDSVWWTGNEAASLADSANVYDRVGEANKVPSNSPLADIDDGFIAISPVGSFRANAFGMHDMVGNVWEHCADMYFDSYADVREGDGLNVTAERPRVREGDGLNVTAERPRVREGDGLNVTAERQTIHRSARGGSCQEGPIYARSASRFSFPQDVRDNDLGFRAARKLKP